jgi:hydroxyethylthiazole kinase-like uncharacterized protein yjeF
MKIFRCDQIKAIDEYTIRNEPVASIDLMERAAGKLAEWITGKFNNSCNIIVFAGPGNNGGDGLALARLLSYKMYEPEIYFVNISSNTSEDWKINKKRLVTETIIPLKTIENINQFPNVAPGSVIIDAIFGSGLSRPASGLVSEVIKKINNENSVVISIDVPSGLFGENNSGNDPESIIKADYTLTFQFPKLSFMLPENEEYTGIWVLLDIGLHKDITDSTETPYSYLEQEQIRKLIKPRSKFSHKGTFGHGLLVGGSYGKMGAVVLGAKAALRTGIGLVTCHIPSDGDIILQSAIPEAMVIHDRSPKLISETGDTESFSAVGVGPGIGTAPETQHALYNLLQKCSKPLVIDADALNILSLNKKWLTKLPEGSILTPHPGEFSRLAGITKSGYERLLLQSQFSEKYKCIIVLKGAHTSITTPDRMILFNSTGNPGMATAGSGDVLTGMILSLLAQGHNPVNASLTGVYMHGLAGDIAYSDSGPESLIASDIIENIGAAFNKIKKGSNQ